MNINSPLPSSLNEECVKCAKILSKFTKPEDAKIHETIKQIPQDIIQNAKGKYWRWLEYCIDRSIYIIYPEYLYHISGVFISYIHNPNQHNQ